MKTCHTAYETVENENGVTLVELMVAVSIFAIVTAGLFSFFSGVNKTFTAQAASADAQQEIRAVVDFMARDIRSLGMDPTGSANAGIVNAGASSLEFTMDLDPSPDGDGALTSSREHLTYALDGTNLKYTDAVSGSDVLLENVGDLNFTYYDEDGNTTSVLSSIRTIEMALTVNEPAGRAGTVSRSATIRITPRNLGLE